MSLGRLKDILVWIGGAGLLVAVAVDALAMLGRQIRIPLVGSIEIVEAAVLFAAGAALIIATLDLAHARVGLILDLVPDAVRAWLERLHALAAVLLFAALLAATIWIAADLWAGHEESELLGIPYRPLRIATAISLGTLLLLSVLSLWRRAAR